MESQTHEKSVPNHENFKDVVTDAIYVDVDPHSCMPYVNIRNTTKSGVLRFLSIFSGRSASFLGPVASDNSCGSGTAVIIKSNSG